MKNIRYIVTLFLLVAAYTFLSNPVIRAGKLALKSNDPVAITEFRTAQLDAETFNDAIETAIEDRDYELAASLVALARSAGHTIPNTLLQKSNPSFVDEASGAFKDGLKGAVTGEFANSVGLGGAIASDLVGIGDIRDVIIEGSAAIKGKEHDNVVLGLAAAGIAISAGALLSGGAGAPIDAGTSIIKNAHKAGKISPALRRHITAISTDIVDIQQLKAVMKQLSVRDLAGSQKRLAQVVKTERLGDIKSLSKTLKKTAGNSGIRSSVDILKYADNTADIKKFQALSSRYKKKLVAVMSLFGKSAIALTGLILSLAAWVIFGLLWLTATAITIYFLARRVLRFIF